MDDAPGFEPLPLITAEAFDALAPEWEALAAAVPDVQPSATGSPLSRARPSAK